MNVASQTWVGDNKKEILPPELCGDRNPPLRLERLQDAGQHRLPLQKAQMMEAGTPRVAGQHESMQWHVSVSSTGCW